MKGAALLIVAGAWILCQALGGKALQRLNIIGSTSQSSASGPSGGGGSGPSGGTRGPVVI